MKRASLRLHVPECSRRGGGALCGVWGLADYILGPGAPALNGMRVLRSQPLPGNLSTGFHLSSGHLVDPRCDWGMAPSHVFLIMALQGPADHRAGQRGRCAPFETGLNIRQRPFFALAPVCQLGAHPTPVAGCSHILTQTGWSTGNRCSAPTPAPMPASRARAHWSQLGCGGGLAGWLLPSTDRNTDRWLHLQQP